MRYRELNNALQIFGLSDRVTLREIKKRHRELVKLHHPDVTDAADLERIQLINAAYRTLLDYVESYRFSFSEEEFLEQNPDERLRMQFEDTPLWGSR